MIIKEYRIPLPMTVEEYRIAQLYMIQVGPGPAQATACPCWSSGFQAWRRAPGHAVGTVAPESLASAVPAAPTLQPRSQLRLRPPSSQPGATASGTGWPGSRPSRCISGATSAPRVHTCVPSPVSWQRKEVGEGEGEDTLVSFPLL